MYTNVNMHTHKNTHTYTFKCKYHHRYRVSLIQCAICMALSDVILPYSNCMTNKRIATAVLLLVIMISITHWRYTGP